MVSSFRYLPSFMGYFEQEISSNCALQGMKNQMHVDRHKGNVLLYLFTLIEVKMLSNHQIDSIFFAFHCQGLVW